MTLRRCSALIVAILIAAPVGAMSLSPAGAGAAVVAPGTFTAVTPQRVLNTTTGVGAPKRAVAPHQAITLSVPALAGIPASQMSAVVLNVMVNQPTATGYITVSPHGSPRPQTSSVTFVKGQTVPNLVVAKLGSGGAIDLYNGSPGTVQLFADASGFYAAGTPTLPGSYSAVSPLRILNSTAGVGVPKRAVGPHQTVSLQVPSLGGAAASQMAAVVINVMAYQPSAAGYITVSPHGAVRPQASSVTFVAGETVPNLVVAKVGSGNMIDFYNGSAGTVQLFGDASGYFKAGIAADAGAFNPLSPLRVLNTTTGVGVGKAAVGPNQTISLPVLGRGGVPASAVAAVTLNVMVYQPTAGGYLTVFPHGASRPQASSVTFVRGQTVPNLVVAKVGSGGMVDFYNGSAGTVQLFGDVSGYHLSQALPVPAASTSRYVRNLSTDTTSNSSIMDGEGCADATANGPGAHLELLHFGAQTKRNLPNPGVLLSGTSTRLEYSTVRQAVSSYLAGYGRCASSGSTVTVALGTNSDGDWTGYPSAGRGPDWATEVVRILDQDPNKPAGVQVVGAFDVEAGFAGSLDDVKSWIAAYKPYLTDLVVDGSADACPTQFGATRQSCGAVIDINGITKVWTQNDYYLITHRDDMPGLVALPQIYLPVQATQWANIAASATPGGQPLSFLGALTEYAACPVAGNGCPTASLPPRQGWAALYLALSAQGLTPLSATSYSTDLRIDS